MSNNSSVNSATRIKYECVCNYAYIEETCRACEKVERRDKKENEIVMNCKMHPVMTLLPLAPYICQECEKNGWIKSGLYGHIKNTNTGEIK